MRQSARLLSCLACLLTVAAAPGCNIFAGAFFIVRGPDEKIEPRYKLNPEKSVVVFVDDRTNNLPRRALRQTIAESAQKILADKGVVRTMIDSRSALAATAGEKYGSPLKIVDIGKAVDADIIIYATVDSFWLSPDGQTFAPEAAIRVKVIDVQADERVWPGEKEGLPLRIPGETRPGYAPEGSSELLQQEQAFGERVGLGIAQMFIDHIGREAVYR